MATATARLSSTTGEGATLPRASYSTTMRSQSVSATDGATGPRPVPPSAVLVLQQHRPPVAVEPRREPCGGQLQEGEQSQHLRLAGQQPGEAAGQAEGLLSEVGADPRVAAGGRGAFGEDQVDDVEHPPQACRSLLGRRDLERDTGRGQGLLGPGDPRLDGRHRDEQQTGDLLGAQATDDPEGEGDLPLLHNTLVFIMMVSVCSS